MGGPGKSTLACDRQALSTEERKRHFEILIPQLGARIRSVHELSGGYRFELPIDSGTSELLKQWAEGERRCCPFFEIALKPEAATLWLRLTGEEGAKQFIRSELPSFFETE